MNYQCVAICNGNSVKTLNLNKLNTLSVRHSRTCNRRRRAVVARQKRTLFIVSATLILGIFLALSMGRMSAHATGAVQSGNSSYRYYKEVRIENGDTLWSIAKAYTDGSISAITECMEDICSINHLGKYDTLKSGNYIIVPYYSSDYIE